MFTLRRMGFCKAVIAGLASAAIFSLPVPVAAEPTRGGTVVITSTPEPPILTNAMSSAPVTNEVATKIFEGLLEYDMDLNPLPSLATSWEVSSDGKTITFQLRDDVTWHDGEPFTSADVQFSLMEVVKSYHPRGESNLGPLESIDTPDAHTVVFHLKHAYVPMMRALSGLEAPIIPRHIYEGTDFRNNEAVNNPIGTGPFKFVEWKKGSHIRLERNDDYWREGMPYLDGIIFRFIADGATRAAALESGEIDIATFGSINPVEMRRLEGLPDISITPGGYEGITPMMLLELNNRRPPFDDKRVRHAVAYAIDRQLIADRIWFGFGKPAVGPISSTLKGSGAFTDEGVIDFTVEDRIDIAEKLLDEAGYAPDKKGVRMKIVHDVGPFGEDWRRMGEYLKQALSKVGIEVELRNSDSPTFVRQVHGNYDFDMTSSWYIGMGDPTLGVQRNTWSKMINPNVPYGNASGHDNPKTDALWEAAQTEADPEKRNEILHDLQRHLVEESPLIWLMEMNLVAVNNDRVQNLITSPLGIRDGLYDMWVSE